MNAQRDNNNAQVDRKDIADQTTSIAVMANKLDNMGEDIREIKESLKEQKTTFVTKIEYESEVGQIKKVVFGIIGLVLTAVSIAGLDFLLKR